MCRARAGRCNRPKLPVCHALLERPGQLCFFLVQNAWKPLWVLIKLIRGGHSLLVLGGDRVRRQQPRWWGPVAADTAGVLPRVAIRTPQRRARDRAPPPPAPCPSPWGSPALAGQPAVREGRPRPWGPSGPSRRTLCLQVPQSLPPPGPGALLLRALLGLARGLGLPGEPRPRRVSRGAASWKRRCRERSQGGASAP